MHRYGMAVVLLCMCMLLTGCGSGSTSFKDEYNSQHSQESFNKKANDVKDRVTSEIDGAKQEVQNQDEQIRGEAKKSAGVISKQAGKEFEDGLDKMDAWSNHGMSTSELIMYYVLKVYYMIREISPALIAVSLFGAVILYIISFGNKSRQKFAVYGLGISVPVVLILIRFVVPWMFVMFGYR